MRFGESTEGATPEAIEELYRSRFRKFLKVAAGVAGERHAADAVHNGFLRALRHRRSFRAGASLEAWVWRTVINAAHDMRRDDRDELLLDAWGETFEPSVNGRPPDGDPLVRAVILNLPPQQRLSVFLRYYADLDYQAIAKVLDVSPGTVAATLHKAHATIRRQLEEDARCMI